MFYADQLEACMYAGAEKINGKLKSWTRFDSKEREQQSVLSLSRRKTSQRKHRKIYS
ncbi:hypothetical protein ACOBV8_19935 (plasmid) [Pseudoalteromonas espejiana]